MTVTATEFKTNMGRYLGMLSEEEIYITKNGKMIAKLVNPNVSAVDSLCGLLAGSIASDYDRHDLHQERLRLHETDD